MPDTVDCVVVGAGVVGLAIARQLQLEGRQVYLVDRESQPGMGITSRSSEVIHAGIYYPADSLKSLLCVRGREMLYAYCQENDVPHRRIGKLILACNDAEVPTLYSYAETASLAGVDDLEWLDEVQLSRLEPHVVASRALLSPSTGIIDSHLYVQSLLEDFERAGGHFVRRTHVIAGDLTCTGINLQLDDGALSWVCARSLVNAAGLGAPDLARNLEGLPERFVPRQFFAAGQYFFLAGKSPFGRLIYPVAVPGGLGIHVTLDMSGKVRFGPDVQWRESVDYGFDPDRAPAFLQAIRRYYPSIRLEDLAPGYTGVRPKLSAPGEAARDFVIEGQDAHGVPGLVNLFGIESPGLTASLAIAERVSNLL